MSASTCGADTSGPAPTSPDRAAGRRAPDRCQAAAPRLTVTTKAQSPPTLRAFGPRMAFTPALKGGAPAKIRGRARCGSRTRSEPPGRRSRSTPRPRSTARSPTASATPHAAGRETGEAPSGPGKGDSRSLSVRQQLAKGPILACASAPRTVVPSRRPARPTPGRQRCRSPCCQGRGRGAPPDGPCGPTCKQGLGRGDGQRPGRTRRARLILAPTVPPAPLHPSTPAPRALPDAPEGGRADSLIPAGYSRPGKAMPHG
ncbi:hypothetical protein QFZ68_007701 [Streptomyces sp. V1I6]|nr:hypothetical protein [Streptomyces sp. V1I6]